MEEWGIVELKIKGPLGVAKPFQQGGVWRLTIPKRVVEKYGLKNKMKDEGFFTYIFLETDKGLFLLPLDKVVNPKNLRNALSFIDTSKLSDDDLRLLLEEK